MQTTKPNRRTLSIQARRSTWIALLIGIQAASWLGCGLDSDSTGDPVVLGSRVASEAVAARIASLESLPIAEAHRQALKEKDAWLRQFALTAVYSRVDASNFGEVRASFEEDLRFHPRPDIETFASLWARVSPDDALREAMLWPVPMAQLAASEEIISVLIADENAEEAIRALSSLEDEIPIGMYQTGEQALGEALAKHGELDLLLELLRGVDDPKHRDRTIQSAERAITRADRNRYIEWAEEIHADPSIELDLKVALVIPALQRLLRRDVQEAIAWYPKIADGAYSGDALATIADTWARTAPIETLEFLATRPDSEQPDLARRVVTILWLKKNPVEARSYLLEAVKNDPEMTAVRLPLAQFLKNNEVELALDVAQGISDPREREIVMEQALVRWARYDPAGADRYLAKHDVSPSIRKKVQLAKNFKTQQRPSTAGSTPEVGTE